jgi:hypothetical protein
MNAPTKSLIPPATLQSLEDHLRQSRSPLSLAEALDRAVRQWVEQDRAAATPVRGYQWKSLFLPETSHLRMSYGGESYYAQVVGEEIIFRGHAVSPRQMTIEIAGDGRNAWRDFWIRMPGEKSWANAALLRARIENKTATHAASPVDAMTAATKAMSDSLNAALLLIEHVDHQSKTMTERRLPKHRRAYDLMDDDH